MIPNNPQFWYSCRVQCPPLECGFSDFVLRKKYSRTDGISHLISKLQKESGFLLCYPLLLSPVFTLVETSLPCCDLSYGKAHLAGNWERSLVRSHQRIEALSPATHEELPTTWVSLKADSSLGEPQGDAALADTLIAAWEGTLSHRPR